mgnify:CR=1
MFYHKLTKREKLDRKVTRAEQRTSTYWKSGFWRYTAYDREICEQAAGRDELRRKLGILTGEDL